MESLNMILEIAGIVYIAATAIATVTPSTNDDTFLSRIGRVFDRIGIQFKNPK